MAFIDEEQSTQEGRPAFFLIFERDSKVWRYTNVDQDITLDSNVYTAIPFSVPDIFQSGDPRSEEMSFSLPSSAGISQYLDTRIPSTEVTVTLRKAHLIEDELTGEFTAPAIADAPVLWVGEIIELKRPQINEREIVCNTLSLTMNRGGLRLSWGRNCPYVLYERGCLVNRASFAVPLATVTVVDGITLSSADADAQPDGWFSGGYIEWNSEPGVVERLGIESHTGPLLTVLGLTTGVAGGSNYVAYPGCARSADVCNTKFSNILNFGGVNHMTGKSPFDGSPVY